MNNLADPFRTKGSQTGKRSLHGSSLTPHSPKLTRALCARNTFRDLARVLIETAVRSRVKWAAARFVARNYPRPRAVSLSRTNACAAIRREKGRGRPIDKRTIYQATGYFDFA